MDDEELEKLREEKKRELEESQGSMEERKKEQQEQVKQLAAQYLTKEAKQRLGNIRAAKPELASAIETQIARLGRSGQVDKITDDQLKDILKSVQGKEKDTDIKFRR